MRTSQGPMRRVILKCSSLLLICGGMQGCLMNSVRHLTSPPRARPDSSHAIAVVGIGLDVPFSYAEFQTTLVEYSLRKQAITGNCFHYNRIEVRVPSSPAKVRYFAFEVPANAYAYLDNPYAPLASSSTSGRAFMAPAGGTVYLGDYVLVGNKTVEYRNDLNAARLGAQALLPRGTVLRSAEPAAAAHAHMLLCTP